MEPLEKALAVIEGVKKDFCRALGNTALDYVNPNRLFIKAEELLNSGVSVDKAIAEILKDLMKTKALVHVDESSEVKSEGSGGSGDRNSQSQNESELFDKSGTAKGSKNLDLDNGMGSNVETSLGHSSSQNDAETFQNNAGMDTENVSSKNDAMQARKKVKRSRKEYRNGFDVKDPANYGPSTSKMMTVWEFMKKEALSDDELGSLSPEGDRHEAQLPEFSPEVKILSPPPKEPVPVVDLEDESTDPPSCSSDVLLVEELDKVENDLQDSAKVEKEMREILFGELNSQSAGSSETPKDQMVDLATGASGTGGNDEGNMQDQAVGSDRIPGNESVDVKDSVALSEEIDLWDQEGKAQPGDDSLKDLEPEDVLWKDAQYICSLLPYFQLADVHQTLLDNFYHPDRKAHVLEIYIDLALDRDEVVPDNVFCTLSAARKRSHVEACGNQVEHNKRLKAHGAYGPILDPLWPPQGPGNVIAGANEPGPSGIIVPVVAARNDAFPQPPPFSVNSDAGTSKEREKWLKEKLEFLGAVVCHIDKNMVRTQLENCQSDADVEALLLRLMEEPIQPEAAGQQAGGRENPAIGFNPPDANSAFQPVEKLAGIARPGPSQRVDDGNAGPESIQGTSGEGSSGENRDISGSDSDAQNANDTEDRIMAQIATLSEMFNDADPDYLYQRCKDINGKSEEFQALVIELMEKKDYPKMEEYLKRQKKLEIRKKFIEGMSVEEFLEYFDDPEKVFCETDKIMSLTYMENTRTQLLRDLPFHLSKDIDQQLRKSNYHYLPALRALQDNKKLSRRKTKRAMPIKDRDMDDIFIKELCYVRMQVEIKEYLLKKEEEKRKAFLWAKAAGELQECGCCYDDEILEEDMDTCSAVGNKHKFCCNCIRRFAEEEIGQGRINFRCLDGECKAEFSLNTLKRVMKPSVFSNILSRKQLEEIAAAGIEDLESCPFCNFQTIMPNQEDKVFKCLNPECMKDSCRLCKEPNHVPLRCEEVEKQQEKDARTFLENKMTEAMVRECWKCKKRFIKLDGCNKMRCSCGAMMCYICKKAIQGYDHFEDSAVPVNKNKCPLWSNSDKIHAEEVRDAAKKLKDQLDPKIALKHDPTKDLPQVPKHLEQRPNAPVMPQIQRQEPHQPPPPPPAHVRRHPHHHRVFNYFFEPLQPPQPPQAHHHHHHHHLQEAIQMPFPAHLQPPPPPIPPLQFVINPVRNDYHHHHHHHYHHMRHRQDARREGRNRDPGREDEIVVDLRENQLPRPDGLLVYNMHNLPPPPPL